MAFCSSGLGLNPGGTPGSNRAFLGSDVVNLFMPGVRLFVVNTVREPSRLLSSFLFRILSFLIIKNNPKRPGVVRNQKCLYAQRH